MCGIAGAVLSHNTSDAAEIIKVILPLMEYRGYDSWGMATLEKDGHIHLIKREKGPSAGFYNLNLSDYPGNVAIGHTRWATQGEVNETNAHPHSGCDPHEFLGVHNGVIENYDTLFQYLVTRGHQIHSQTDSEIILHLVEDERVKNPHLPFEKLLAVALRKIEGPFGFAGIYQGAPNTLVVACKSSPVHIGIIKDHGRVIGHIVASDRSALNPYAEEYMTLEDNQVGVLTAFRDHYFDLQLNIIHRNPVQKLQESEDEVRKDGHPHFMLKELFETAEAIRRTTRGRTIPLAGTARLGGIEQYLSKFRKAQRILIIASGTSEHAGLVGGHLLDTLAEIPTTVVDASEFLYGRYTLRKTDVVIFVSQSGETADVYRAVQMVKDKGIFTVGIVNKVGSKIAHEVDCGVYLRVGPEIGVASTKAFIGQVAVFVLLALLLSRAKRKITKKEGQCIINALHLIPEQIEDIISRSEEIRTLAEKYTLEFNRFIFFGRDLNSIVACEAALKLLEVSGIVTLGIAAGKMKHGFIAAIKDIEKGGFPTCFIAPHEGDPAHDELFVKTLTNIREVRTRKGAILAIATKGNHNIRQWVDDVFFISETHHALTPLLTTVVTMLFAYYAAVARNLNPDQPDNLAKSVTVE